MPESAPEHDDVLRVRRWVGDLRDRITALSDMLDTCGEFLEQRARVRADLRERGLTAPPVDPGRLAMGAPLLADVSLACLADDFRNTGRRLIPSMSTAFPAQAGELLRVLAGIESGNLDPAACMEAWLRGDDAVIEAQGEKTSVAPPSLAFAVGQIVRPVLEVTAQGMAEAVAEARWRKGHCPVCGAGPEMSVFRASGDDDAYLKSHGGQRWLRCSRCAAMWRHKRHACPACDNEEHGTLRFLMLDPEGNQRADVCEKCRRYVTGIDVRNLVDEPDLDVAALAMLPLDIQVQREGFTPVAETIWNQID